MNSTIFVSIASYRDNICPVTLESIFLRAKNPSRVFIGICQQNTPEDPDCRDTALRKLPQYRNHVRVVRLRHDEAKGPTYARYLCATLYDQEDYFLQIDSHCKFVRGWDELMIGMILDLKRAGYAKPVLSHYTPSIDDYKEEPSKQESVTTICEAWFTKDNLISLLGAGWNPHEDLPRPNAYIAGGMFFCEGSFLKEIPFDPDLDYLFIGEELVQSIRFYTHGWDIFSPNVITLYHFYTREKDPKFWENKNINASPASQKVRYLLGLDTDLSKLTDRQKDSIEIYGLGKVRTLQDYYDYAGIDIKKKRVTKNMCTLPREEILTIVSPTTKKKKSNSSSASAVRNYHYLWLVVLFVVLVLLAVWAMYRNV